MSNIHPSFQDENESDHWISVADMMAGLMVIFLFIAISYILFKDEEIAPIPIVDTLEDVPQDPVQDYQQNLEDWKKKLAELIKAQEIERAIFIALEEEFKNDLPTWGAELSRDLTILFKSPDILFDTNSAKLKPRFEEVLSDFIPRYLKILSQFKISIEEIRIEGHTSSKWGDANPIVAYFNNMELSQSRTRAVLEYSLSKTGAWNGHAWARPLLTANGLSSSRLVKPDGIENPELSRRVEFKIRTKVKQEILNILEELQ